MPEASKTLELVFRGRDQVTSELRKIQPALERTERVGRSAFRGIASAARLSLGAVRGITSGIFGLVRSLSPLGAITGLVGGVGFAALIKSSANLGDRLAKLSDRLGLTTEFLSEMEFVAERSGVRVESLGIGFQRATRRIEQFVRTGRGPAAEAFEILGGGLAEAARSGQNFEQLLPRLADAFANLGTEQQRVAAAFQLFDSEGASFTQFLQTGSEGVRELREEAERLGVTINRDAADAAANFNDKLSNLTRAFRGLTFSVARQFFDGIARAFDTIANFIANNRTSIVDFFKQIAEVSSTFVTAIVSSFGDAGVREALITFFSNTFVEVFSTVGELSGRVFLERFTQFGLNIVTRTAGALARVFGQEFNVPEDRSGPRVVTIDLIRRSSATIGDYYAELQKAIPITKEVAKATRDELTPAVTELSEAFGRFTINNGAADSPFTQFAKGFSDAATEIKAQFEDLNRIGDRFAGDLFRSLSDNFFAAAKREFESFRDFVLALFTSLVDSILRILSDQAASQIVGLFGNLLGGGYSNATQDAFFSNPPPLILGSAGGVGSGPVVIPSGTDGIGSAASSISQGPEITVVINATDARSFRNMLLEEGSTLASALTNALAGNQTASSGFRRAIA